MPIQPVKYQNYKEIQDLEDVTPVVNRSDKQTTSGNCWCKQHFIFWIALFILAIVLVLCIFFGVDDELSSALIYQTSFGVTGGINKFKSQLCGNGISMTTCSTIETIKATILVSSTNKFQSIIGFGGAFTESAGYVFSKLSTKTQDKVIELYFGESGIGFTLGRIHINSCDFSLSSYNYDDQLDDFDLDHFDSGLIRDSMYVIPLIRLAMAASSLPILLVASPWSPPAWMKVSHPMSAHVSDTQQYWQAMTGSAQPHGLRDDARVKTAWAMYIAKFLEAYSAKGVPVWAVTPQNEPEFAAPWEACVFNASYEGAFIAGYLGPVLRERLPQVKILGFDHNKDHLLQWAQVLMGDPAVEPFLDGMAFHWYGGNDRTTDGTYGYEAVRATHLLRPDKILLATEGCSCPGVRLDDWLRAERLAHDVMYDLMNFGQGWIDWNLLLDSTGGPNHLGNQCDAPLVALSDFSDVHVQPTYYYMGHISKFVPPGSIRVQASIVGDFELRPMDPNIQAGVELGLFPCERSVRQTWQLRPEGNASNLFSIALSTPALRTDSFIDAVHSDDDLPPVISSLCVASGDANRGYLRLVDCGDASSSDSSSLLQVKLSDQGQMVDRESNLCVGLSADSLESGALLSLGACVEASPTQTFSVDDRTGEIRWKGVSEADPFCWTAGWPFLSTVGFLDPEGRTVLVVLNEASVAVEITIISDLLRKESIISDRSIQTIIF